MIRPRHIWFALKRIFPPQMEVKRNRRFPKVHSKMRDQKTEAAGIGKVLVAWLEGQAGKDQLELDWLQQRRKKEESRITIQQVFK